MFKIVIGNSSIGEKSVELSAIFFNHIPVSHADVANMLNIHATHGGFAALMDDTHFLEVYGCSISLNKSVETLDKVELNKKLRENVFVRLPYYTYSYQFDIWMSTTREAAELFLQTHDNFSDSIIVDFTTFSEQAEKSFRDFFE